MALNVVNTVLCITIVVLGFLSYRKGGGKLPLYIGIAFGIFGFSHILALLGFEESLMGFLIMTRAIAYLLVVIALFMTVKWK